MTDPIEHTTKPFGLLHTALHRAPELRQRSILPAPKRRSRRPHATDKQYHESPLLIGPKRPGNSNQEPDTKVDHPAKMIYRTVAYEQISVRMEQAGEHHVKVVWSDSKGLRFPPYRLYRKWLAEKAAAARSALGDLRAEYLRETPRFDPVLETLAQRGAELLTALFNDHVPEDSFAAIEPRDWFADVTQGGNDPIQIMAYADPVLPIPWGLLHSGFPANRSGCIYDSFWAIRHNVVALYGGMSPQTFRVARPAENIRLLTGLNQEVFERTKLYLDPVQQNYIVSFLDRSVGLAFTSAGCRKRWEEVGDNDCLFHFFGHASGSELRFSDTDVLTASGFRGLFYRQSRVVRPRSDSGYILSFLNGCASVSGHDSESFLVATAYPGFCGFIGAEAIVPDRFALLFGQELLHCLLDDGLSVREAMSQLWLKHRPMGLFYGCYAHPDFKVTRANPYIPLPSAFGPANFRRGLGAQL
jgi:hypothetical protein